MPMRSAHSRLSSTRRQRGAAFMIMLVILIIGAVTIFVRMLNSSALQIARDQTTADALAKAKEALIGYAASVDLASGNNRPGDLPCPDTDNDGFAASASVNTCDLQSQRIGRLPWKTLGLPDLRDGSGERLWYAVSTNFKNSTRTPTLNSDTPGTISIFASDGTVLNDGGSAGSGSSGAVAVIVAPGEVLTRQGGMQQDRSGAGINTATNYLDIATIGGVTEDNASFSDGSSTNGFIQGRVKDSNGNVIVNDQLIVVTQDNIMQVIQKRVAAEVKQCLNQYASPTNGGFGRYPWAAKLDQTQPPNYNDTSNQLVGRVPDPPFDNTRNDGDNIMNNTWAGNCSIPSPSGWWLNWKEMVFYGLASAYKPVDPPSTPATCGMCLSVNPPSAAADKKFVVIVAGKTLPGQVRISNSDKGSLSNYLEPPNNSGASPFAQKAPSATFTDTVVFQ